MRCRAGGSVGVADGLAAAVLGAIGGFASGAATWLLRSVLEDWQSRQRETRERKREDLDKLADLFRRQPMDPMLLRMAAASTADPDLVAQVGRLITAIRSRSGRMRR